MADVVLIHYSEIALKGQNRPFFEKKLVENIKQVLREESIDSVKRVSGRIVLTLNEQSDLKKIRDRLQDIFGIAYISPAYSTDQSLDSIETLILERCSKVLDTDSTIRVYTKRADKRLPFTSLELNRRLGSRLVENFGVKVDMTSPQHQIYVELVGGRCYVYFERSMGLGGLPVGTNGRALVLLSGGIDSPVAAWMLMKRGCHVDHLHFHPFRNGMKAVESKIVPMVKQLTRYSLSSGLYIVPFYPFQIAALKIPQRYTLLLFRRFMLKVAEALALKIGARAIATGESLGQVSSQTLENISAIEEAVKIGVLRPLLAYDKMEIVDLAKKIEIYPISLIPYKDCCASLIARHPETRADPQRLSEFEDRIGIESVVKESLKLTESVFFKRTGEDIEIIRNVDHST